jgi:hypothetical protein
MTTLKTISHGICVGFLAILASVLLILPFTGIVTTGIGVLSVIISIVLAALVAVGEATHTESWPWFVSLLLSGSGLTYVFLLLL